MNSESPIFIYLLKSLFIFQAMDETRPTWTMLSKLKALVNLRNSELSFFIVVQTITWNSILISLPSIVPCVREKIPSYRSCV